mmetsp:Transcript_1221/g.3711  ORF Transcript_1221/g.3711 Transcript_1221/m.3711 type:complete len:255 (+) Transcript_1221:265-1029(+)
MSPQILCRANQWTEASLQRCPAPEIALAQRCGGCLPHRESQGHRRAPACHASRNYATRCTSPVGWRATLGLQGKSRGCLKSLALARLGMWHCALQAVAGNVGRSQRLQQCRRRSVQVTGAWLEALALALRRPGARGGLAAAPGSVAWPLQRARAPGPRGGALASPGAGALGGPVVRGDVDLLGARGARHGRRVHAPRGLRLQGGCLAAPAGLLAAPRLPAPLLRSRGRLGLLGQPHGRRRVLVHEPRVPQGVLH